MCSSVVCSSLRTSLWNTWRALWFEGRTKSCIFFRFRFFYIPTKEWRIKWSYVAHELYSTLSLFNLFIYPKGETELFIDMVYKMGESADDMTYIHQASGDFYLKINVANLQSYKIILEYYMKHRLSKHV